MGVRQDLNHQYGTGRDRQDFFTRPEHQAHADFFEPLGLIPAIGTFALILSKLFKGVGSAAKGWGKMKEADLDGTKKALNDILLKMQRKIIVVIDDIDRLNNNEIRQIFQLVKSLGDFSNTVYLLAFDKQVVINALTKVQEGPGADYLEKVVQVPFEIPLISQQDVERFLFNQLDALIKDIPEARWDQTYWGNIYHSGLRHFFKNIRDVTRYINSLRFSLEMVKDVVNPIDFLAVTGLQVFMPDIYYGYWRFISRRRFWILWVRYKHEDSPYKSSAEPKA